MQNHLESSGLIIMLRGGEEVLTDVGGEDATEAFEDVGHSDEARDQLAQLLVGTLKRMVRVAPNSGIPACSLVEAVARRTVALCFTSPSYTQPSYVSYESRLSLIFA